MLRCHRRSLLALPLAAALAGCSTFSYDLSQLPYPVTATPSTAPGLVHEPFELRDKDTIWVHQLFGESSPDVAAMLKQHCGDCAGVANFRVVVAGNLHDWLLTHLTLGLIRMKTVTIRGEKLVKKA